MILHTKTPNGLQYKAALCVLLTALLLAAAGCGPSTVDAQRPTVAVYVGNALYTAVPFGEEQVITVDQSDGRVNEITFTGTDVHMSHATCDNQDCIEQGMITMDNYETRPMREWIICLPNGVTVEYIPGETE